jgi:nucleotide-binding universal stress UspA family protein
MAFVSSGEQALSYVESRQYTEPLFVFVVMVVAASRPVVEVVGRLLGALARLMPVREIAAQVRESGCAGVIMGTRGMGPIATVMIGSVANRVVQIDDGPVTLVK